jgi:hypothetical protein
MDRFLRTVKHIRVRIPIWESNHQRRQGEKAAALGNMQVRIARTRGRRSAAGSSPRVASGRGRLEEQRTNLTAARRAYRGYTAFLSERKRS